MGAVVPNAPIKSCHGRRLERVLLQRNQPLLGIATRSFAQFKTLLAFSKLQRNQPLLGIATKASEAVSLVHVLTLQRNQPLLGIATAACCRGRPRRTAWSCSEIKSLLGIATRLWESATHQLFPLGATELAPLGDCNNSTVNWASTVTTPVAAKSASFGDCEG